MAHEGYQLEDLLRLVVAECGDGLRLMPGEVPSIIVEGKPNRVEGPPLTTAETDHFLRSLATSRQMRTFWEEHLLEFECLVLGTHPVRVYATDDGETVLLEIQRLGN